MRRWSRGIGCACGGIDRQHQRACGLGPGKEVSCGITWGLDASDFFRHVEEDV